MRPPFPRWPGWAVTALAVGALARIASAENAWTSYGPTDAGYVSDVAAARSVAYAGTINGVFRSEDGGASWKPAGLQGGHVDRVVVFPGTDVALALSDFEAYITVDRGETWRPAATGLPYPYASAVAIDPFRPSTAYFGTLRANGADIFRSSDRGATWEPFAMQPFGLLVSAISVSPVDGTLYIKAADQFHKSVDDGVTWERISAPIGSPSAIAAGPSGTVYAGRDGQVCRSADAWGSWSCADFPATPTRILELPSSPPGAQTLRVLVASAEGLYSSDDGGATWARAAGELGSQAYPQSVDSDPSGALVLTGTGSGVFISRDRGESWTRSGTGLRACLIQAIALDPNDYSTVWAGAGGSGVFRSLDSGHSWSTVGGLDGPQIIQTLALDPRDSGTILAGGTGLSRSSDGGAHWTNVALPDGAAFVTAVAFDPGSPDHVWASTEKGLARSDDGGRSFYRGGVSQSLYCLLFDGREDETLYGGSYSERVDTFYGPEYDGGRVFRSVDGGSSWTVGDQRFENPIFALAVDPFTPGVIYAAPFDGSIYRSADRGATWELVGAVPSNNLLSLVADPVRPGALYAATIEGVFRTADGGRWRFFSTGLDTGVQGPLVISPDGKWLYASSPNDGVYVLDLVTREIVPPRPEPSRRPRTVGTRRTGQPP